MALLVVAAIGLNTDGTQMLDPTLGRWGDAFPHAEPHAAPRRQSAGAQ
jgi:hypothetical protein